MSFLGIHILSDAAVQHLKDAGHQVEAFALSEAQKAVLALKTTSIGAAVANDIQAVASHELTGAQKFEAVLANTLPLIVTYLTGGGVAAALSDVEDIGRHLVQSLFNDVASTNAGKVGGEILNLLHLA